MSASGSDPGAPSCVPGGDGGWVLLPLDAVPDRWKSRARKLALVPLLPEEMASVLNGEPAAPALEERDEQIARLLTQGTSLSGIGRAVGLSPRGVQHRIARLRQRFEVRSNAELVAHLARHGLSMERTRQGLPQEPSRRGKKG